MGDIMSKISNILLMLQYLNNGRKYSIKELSSKLEVSNRMIRLYKEELEKAGIFIDTIMGPYGGYVLNQRVSITLIKFSLDDYNFLNSIKVDNNDKDRLNSIIDKVHYLCSDNIEIDDNIKKFYNILSRGIREHRKVRINYSSYTNGEQDRVIRPYDMFLFSNGWGCAAYCELKKDLRHFELKRINDIELLEEKF